jgi:alpha-amylase
MEYFNLNNSYGSMDEQRGLLAKLLADGVEPVADLVLNHRSGERSWADFKNPDWGLWSICSDDSAFSSLNSPLLNTPVSQRGAPEEFAYPYTSHRTYSYPSFRNIDHTNVTVRKDVLRYLLELKSLGYLGWRYDMVHGYHAKWVAMYNRETHPTFSVGEYDWGAHAEQRGWIWYSATKPGDLTTASNVFDFTTFFSLKNGIGSYGLLYGNGNGIGMIGDNTDGIAWKQRSVTFVENHDTGYRTNDDGTAQSGHQLDTFANNWRVEQAYAYILTHPGVPCVFWKHYFEWGSDLQNKIRALINARKVAGVNSGSVVNLQDNARQKNVYSAMIQGTRGQLYVRIGGTDADWQPSSSGYANYREYAVGNGWHVWAAMPGNPEVEQAPFDNPLPKPPAYTPGNDISVTDAMVKP